MFSPLSRRQALKLGATAAVGAVSLPLVSCTRSSAKPKHIIFMVSDGMSLGVPTLAEAFSRLLGKGETNWHALARRPETVHGFFDMASLNSIVTDSAPASSSWGTGSRIFNRVINVLPDGTALQPIAHAVKASGRSMGLVTTATITHATPAGFAAVSQNRDDEALIATQYLNLVDVLLGGGLGFFDPEVREDTRDLLGEYKQAGYAVLKNRSELTAASGQKKILGLFDPHFLPFTVDWNNSTALQQRVPTLAEMSTLALQSLRQNPNGFLLQIEGARVDHAAHANDPAAILWDQLAFDAALGVALDFVRSNPDTLLIVTSDHGNSNPGLNGMGKEYSQSNACFARLKDFRASTLLMLSDLQRIVRVTKTVKPEEVLARVKDGTGLTLAPEQAQALADLLTNKPVSVGNQQHANFVGLLGEFTGNHTGIGWTGTTHTADYTPILALGPGAEGYHGLRLNTDSYPHLTGLMGVPHRNPSITPEEAARFRKELASAENEHWQRHDLAALARPGQHWAT